MSVPPETSGALRDALRVYVIIDPEHCADRAPLDVARRAVSGGATCLQLRAKRLDDRERVDLGRALSALARRHRALFIMNDRVDLALATDAHGVHVGPHDLPVETARRLLGLDGAVRIVGASASSPARARELEAAGADYLGCGALYDASDAKPDASAPRGAEWVAEIARAVSIPVVGIGGITPERAGDVVRHGAAGVAVIRAVCAASDPAAAARQLRTQVDGARDAG